MKKGNIIIRIDDNLKKDFMDLLAHYDFTMSDVLVTFIKDVVNKGKLPLNILSKLNEARPSILLNIFEIKKALINSSLIKNTVIKKIYLVGDYAKGIATKKSEIILNVVTNGKMILSNLNPYKDELISKLNKGIKFVLNDELSEEEKSLIELEEICLFENN